jgi:hypothetical protein
MEQSKHPIDRGKVVLIMKVQITDETAVKLLVHEYDEPEILAKKFCKKYNLNHEAEIKLEKEIENQIDILLDELEGPDTGASTVKSNPVDHTPDEAQRNDKILEQASSRLKLSSESRFTSISPDILESRLNQNMPKCNNESPGSFDTTHYSRRVISHNPSPTLSPMRATPCKSPVKYTPTPREMTRTDSPGKKRSLQIYEKLQEERIQHIFKVIGGFNGILKKGSLNTNKLPRNLVEILNPVIEVLDVVKYDIFYSTFQKLIQQLLKSISQHEKDQLLLPKHRWARHACRSQFRDSHYSMSLLSNQQLSSCRNLRYLASDNEFTFHPKINKHKSSNKRSEISMNS